jgi:hypothetical protein
LREKCILRASSRKGLAALSVCVGGGGGGGADLEVDPAQEINSANDTCDTETDGCPKHICFT